MSTGSLSGLYTSKYSPRTSAVFAGFCMISVITRCWVDGVHRLGAPGLPRSPRRITETEVHHFDPLLLSDVGSANDIEAPSGTVNPLLQSTRSRSIEPASRQMSLSFVSDSTIELPYTNCGATPPFVKESPSRASTRYWPAAKSSEGNTSVSCTPSPSDHPARLVASSPAL